MIVVNHDTSLDDNYHDESYVRRMGLSKRIKQARRQADLTQEQLGERVNVGQSTVAMWEKDGGNEPNIEKIKEIASALSVRLEWLVSGKGSSSFDSHAIIASEPHEIPHNIVQPGPFDMQRDNPLKALSPENVSRVRPGDKTLPILGYAQGGAEGMFMDNGKVQGYTERPGVLDGVPGAYAVRVHDISMEPVLRHGFLCWVDPQRPPAPGDEVVIQLPDGRAFIKTLVRRSQKTIKCRQYNPAGDVEYPADGAVIHLIVGSTRIRS